MDFRLCEVVTKKPFNSNVTLSLNCDTHTWPTEVQFSLIAGALSQQLQPRQTAELN
jgi:hypothetical protein